MPGERVASSAASASRTVRSTWRRLCVLCRGAPVRRGGPGALALALSRASDGRSAIGRVSRSSAQGARGRIGVAHARAIRRRGARGGRPGRPGCRRGDARELVRESASGARGARARSVAAGGRAAGRRGRGGAHDGPGGRAAGRAPADLSDRARRRVGRHDRNDQRDGRPRPAGAHRPAARLLAVHVRVRRSGDPVGDRGVHARARPADARPRAAAGATGPRHPRRGGRRRRRAGVRARHQPPRRDRMGRRSRRTPSSSWPARWS